MSNDTEQQPDFRNLSSVEMTNMIEEIQQLATSEHEQLFKILKSYTAKYTENLNGVFVNLAHVPNEALHKLKDVLTFWKDQRQHIEMSEIERTHIHLKPNNNIETDVCKEESVMHRDVSKQDVECDTDDTEPEATALFSTEMTVPHLNTTQIKIIKGEEKKKKKKKNHIQLKIRQIPTSTTAQRVAKKCMKNDLD